MNVYEITVNNGNAQIYLIGYLESTKDSYITPLGFSTIKGDKISLSKYNVLAVKDNCLFVEDNELIKTLEEFSKKLDLIRAENILKEALESDHYEDIEDVLEYRFTDRNEALKEIIGYFREDRTNKDILEMLYIDWVLNDDEIESKEKIEADFYESSRHPDEQAFSHPLNSGKKLISDYFED